MFTLLSDHVESVGVSALPLINLFQESRGGWFNTSLLSASSRSLPLDAIPRS